MTTLPKQFLLGRPLRIGQMGETLLPKCLALPVFCSDPLSSVAYATEETLTVFALAGVALLHLTWWVPAAIVFLLIVVVASYRQTCHAYPGAVDPAAADELKRTWHSHEIGVPLKVLDPPYREITRPVLECVRTLRRESPRDVVTVLIPEYVLGHWWEQILHNQSALRPKARLLFTSGVMVIGVPYLLQSAQRRKARERKAVEPQREAVAEKA